MQSNYPLTWQPNVENHQQQFPPYTFSTTTPNIIYPSLSNHASLLQPNALQRSFNIPIDNSPPVKTNTTTKHASQKKGKKNVDKSNEGTSKGREAARQFRERQRVRVEELEKQIAELELEHTTYKTEVDKVRTENEKIREQQRRLRYAISEALLAAYPEKPLKAVPIDTQPKPEKVYA